MTLLFSAARTPVAAGCALLCLMLVQHNAWAQSSTPSAPTIYSVTSGDTQLKVDWTAPTGETGITAYDVRHIETSEDETDDTKWTVVDSAWTSGTLEYAITGLDNGTGYDVQVRAVNSNGDGTWSGTEVGTPEDHGDSRADATSITPDGRVRGVIDPTDDVDYFQFSVSDTADIWVYTEGDLNTVGEVQDSSGTLLATDDYGGVLPSPNNFFISLQLQAGTYYVKVTGSWPSGEPYVLRLRQFTDTTSRSDAATLSINGSAGGTIFPKDDHDYFKLVLSETAEVAIRSSGFPNTTGELQDSGGTVIATNEDGHLPQHRIDFLIRERLSAGTYYVKVNSYLESNVGPYTVFATAITEPGSTVADALPLTLGVAAGGTIDPAGDEDYFSLTLDEKTHVMVGGASQEADISTEFRDSNNLQALINLAPEFEDDKFLFAGTLDAGTYTLKVTGEDGNETGRYTVIAVVDVRYAYFENRCSNISRSSGIDDPFYGCQWHLNNDNQYGDGAGQDIRVEDVWPTYTGSGINVAVVDDGLHYDHEDLRDNVLTSLNHNYSPDGTDLYSYFDDHGTAVAGLIAAKDNSLGVRGVAPEANIYAYNYLAAQSFASSADAASRNSAITAVSNNSWGPGDYGAPQPTQTMWETAVEHGVTYGYGGRGVAYVRSAGNGGSRNDHSNLDEQTNYYAVTTACAVGHDDKRSSYSESGYNLWVCGPSNSGRSGQPGIITTDNGNRYRDDFGGTSAAAPIVSGVIALIREANSALTWRDVKLILAASARKNDPDNTGWEQGALKYGSTSDRYNYNHEYGFGMVDAKSAVDLATTWTSLPEFRETTTNSGDINLAIPDAPSLGTPTTVSTSLTVEPYVGFMEYVEVHTHFDHSSFRDLNVELVSPSGAVSVLTPSASVEFPSSGRAEFALTSPFRFGSARHLGEDAGGEWTLRIRDEYTDASGTLRSWGLTVYGHGDLPGPPDIDTVTPGRGTLSIAWKVPAITGDSAIASYDLRYIRADATDRSDDSWTLLTDVGSLSNRIHTISGLDGGVEYNFQVRAHNGSGPGPWSEPGIKEPAAIPPSAPTVNTITRGDRALGVSWSAPSVTGGADITAYDVRYIETSADETVESNWTVRDNAWRSGVLQYVIMSLTNSTEYDVQVRAVNEAGDGTWSETETGTPLSDNVPIQMQWDSTGLVVSENAGNVVLKALFTTDGNTPPPADFQFDLIVTTADLSATRDEDYTPPASSTTFVASDFIQTVVNGQQRYRATRDISAAIMDDTEDEPDEDFRVTMNYLFPDLPHLRGEPQSATVTIRDNDHVPVTLGWEPDTQWPWEHAGSVTVLASVATTVDKAPDQGFSVDASIYSSDVSATQPDDYSRVNETVTFDWDDFIPVTLDGNRRYRATKQIVVSIEEDEIDEYDEHFTVTFEYLNPGSPHLQGGPQVATVVIIDNEGIAPPVTTASTTLNYRENGTSAVHTFSVTDPVQGNITWSLSGTDDDDFTISGTGVLSFASPPDFENPTDSDRDNVYNVSVVATDSALNAFANEVTVTVTGYDEAPEVSGSQALSFTENQATDRVLATYSATDPEDTSAVITRWSLSGTDAGDFTIDESGQLRFRNIPDYERPADSGGNNVYNLSVRASDGRNYGYLAVEVTVEDVNEPPTVTGTDTFSYRENGTAALHTFRATDPEMSSITWSLSGPDEDDFSIDQRGQLTFSSAPNFEAPTDSGRDNVYNVAVQARDVARNTGSLDVVVTVTGYDEAPEVSGTQTLSFTENQSTDRVLATYSATDPEEPSAAITRWSVSGTDAGDFTMDGSGQLRFRNIPDYERPADSGSNNVYNFSVRASDGRNDGHLAVEVTVENVNESPAVTGTDTFSYRENGTNSLHTYRATDPEESAISWSLSGPDRNNFVISETGVLSFASSPDFESPTDSNRDNVYNFSVVATDDAANAIANAVAVTVTGYDEGPELSGVQSLSFRENHSTDAVLASYSATDPEEPTTVITRWSLSGTDAGDFTIDESGQLRFRNVPDYERAADSGRNNVYNFSVRASDGRNYGYLPLEITVTDVNEPPVFNSSSRNTFTYRENGTAALYTFRATDPERSAITWALSGPDDDDFAVSETGVLTFASSPNFEIPADSGRDNVYDVTVEAKDTALNTSSFQVTVTVTGYDEGPEVSGTQTLSFTENQSTDRVLASYTGVDPEIPSMEITRWSLSGTDGGDFTIDESGQLRFRNVPDYERAADSGRNNVYNFSVRASDGRNYGYLPVEITVTDVNEPPVFNSSSRNTFSYRENGTAALYTFRATDPERSEITWALSGADRDDFTVSETGVLAFTNSPNFEIPADSGRDNVHDVTVEARDTALNTGSFQVTITVTGYDEGPEVSGTQTLSFTENQSTDRVLASYTAVDPEIPSMEITRWSLSGTDAGDFTVDEFGQLRFRNVPDYERAADSGRNNVYNFSIRASDGRNYGYLAVEVTVENVDEPPVFNSSSRNAFNYRENGTAALYTFRATDPERSEITWALSGPDDDDFSISEIGVLTFANSPNYEIPSDSGRDNVYDITVEAKDTALNTGSFSVVVTVTGYDEGPEVSGTQTLSFTENQSTDRVLTSYTAVDPEIPSMKITRWSLSGTDAGDFTVDESGQLRFRNVPDYERAADSGRNNVYNFSVRASDGRNYGYLPVEIIVTDVNEPPVFNSSSRNTFSYRENGTSALYTFRATDPERSAITWSLAGADNDDFSISETGVLTFASSPNFEIPTDSGRDNVYDVTVEAKDTTLNTGSFNVVVTVTGYDEGPEVSGTQTLSFTENQGTDRILASYTAIDPEIPSMEITRWSLSGTDAGDFTVDEFGQLRFRNVPDYERAADSGRNNVYNFSLRASDGRNYGYLPVEITVTDVNEPPVFNSSSRSTFSYRENGTAALYTFRATDPERSEITWALSGADRDDFTVSETGVLAFTNSPNFEIPADSGRDNVYDVTVEAKDTALNTGSFQVTVTVTGYDEGPEVSGTQALSFTENQGTERVLASYTAIDPEIPSMDITRWSLSGTDGGDFTVDEFGQLRFRNVPDYERAADSGRNNVYNFSVRASDGRNYGYLPVEITVTDVNEPPVFNSSSRNTFSYRENGTNALYTFRATDPERSAITWSLSGADRDDFTVRETGVLTFSSSPNFEIPADSGRDNVYDVTVEAKDTALNTGSFNVVVTVTGYDEGPEVSGTRTLSFTENQSTDRILASYTAIDPEIPSMEITRWSLSGTDAGDFTVDEFGQLRFRNIPDYERAADSGRNNVYNFSVRASDGRNYGYLSVEIAVTDVNEPPVFNSSSRNTFSYRENGTAALYTFRATDPERSEITWSLSGADNDDFAISETGVLTFASPPNFEIPADSGRDNVYDVTVEARDTAFNTGSFNVMVTVTGYDEGPEVSGTQTLSFTENQSTDRVLASYTAVDPEIPSMEITRWSLSGTDAGDFTIDENAQLRFRNVPDYERAADSGRNNVYNFSVRASDGRNYGYLPVEIAVTDVNEPPVFNSSSRNTFSYRENGTAALYTFRATDPERSAITWALSGADDDDFTISETGVLTFASPPNFEIPADSGRDNVYDVTVEAKDTALNTGSFNVVVTVTGYDEGPEVSGTQTLSFTENLGTERVLASYTAVDPEIPSMEITRWSLSGTDAGDFTVDEFGQLRFRNIPDYERAADSGRNNIYNFSVRASDRRNYGYLPVEIVVTDVNEPPVFNSSSRNTFSYRENGTSALYTFRATDPERSEITWSLSGADNDDFAISETGVLTFASPPNFEIPADSGRDNVYDVTVEAKDTALNAGSFNVVVTVTGYDEGPEVSGTQTLSFAENQSPDRVLASYTAVDPEIPSMDITRWSLSGTDAGDFTVDESGQLRFRNVPDFERAADSGRNNVYNFSVRASDGRNYGYLPVEITVEDVNEPPVFNSSSRNAFSYRENGTSALYTFRATDPERREITWALSGADRDDFSISETGVLTFSASPNFEIPADSGRDNVYDVTVEAKDTALNTGSFNVMVTVTGYDEGPEVSGTQTLSFTENLGTERVLASYTAIDPEIPSMDITRWSLSGTDAGDFTMDERGQLRFGNVPDYERPADSGRNNVYNFSVRASDGRNYGYLPITITVTNVNEPPVFRSFGRASFDYSENDITSNTYRENDLDSSSYGDYALPSSSSIVSRKAGTDSLFTFRATDPEQGDISWSLTGPDRGDFSIDENGNLSFRNVPDYQRASDSNRDNVYEVTVVATDSSLNSATLDMVVTVYEEGVRISEAAGL